MVEFLINAYLRYGLAVKPEATQTFSNVPRLSEDVGNLLENVGVASGGGRPNEVEVGWGLVYCSRVKTILLYHISHTGYCCASPAFKMGSTTWIYGIGWIIRISHIEKKHEKECGWTPILEAEKYET